MIRPATLSAGWPHVSLGDAVEFLDHLRKPITASERTPGPYPYYGANGQQDSVGGYLFDEPLVLLAEDGGYFDDPSRGVAYGVTGKCWVNNHAHVLRPKAEFDFGFLKWHLAHYDLSEFVNGTTRGKLTKGAAERILLIKPPLSVQRRIADILDKADAIRQKRKEAIGLTEDLLRSTFLEMFGDPVTNPKRWPKQTLGELCDDDLRYGTSEKCSTEKQNGALPVLRIPNVVHGEVSWSDLKYANLAAAEDARLRLLRGDILFVRSNGNPDYIGRCAAFDDDRPALFASYLIRARVRAGMSTAGYLRAAFSTPQYRHVLTKAARTTAGNYNISAESLRALVVPIPPPPLRERYALLEQTGSRQRSALAEAENAARALLASLVERAFAGSLR